MDNVAKINEALRAASLPVDGVCAVHETVTPSVVVACAGGVYRLDFAGPMSDESIALMVKAVGEACGADAQLVAKSRVV